MTRRICKNRINIGIVRRQPPVNRVLEYVRETKSERSELHGQVQIETCAVANLLVSSKYQSLVQAVLA